MRLVTGTIHHCHSLRKEYLPPWYFIAEKGVSSGRFEVEFVSIERGMDGVTRGKEENLKGDK